MIWALLFELATESINLEEKIIKLLKEISTIASACQWPHWLKGVSLIIISSESAEFYHTVQKQKLMLLPHSPS